MAVNNLAVVRVAVDNKAAVKVADNPVDSVAAVEAVVVTADASHSYLLR